MAKRALAPTKDSTVLIVGDWVVDDHWVLGLHRSPSGSRTGERHTRSLHDSDSSVRSLCGAGQVATILHQAKATNSSALFEVSGLGIWHEGDDSQLMEMLDPSNNVGNTPYLLDRSITQKRKSPESRLVNLFAKSPGYSGTSAGTTRVIRLYEQAGSTLRLSRRIDWEQDLTEDIRTQVANRIERIVNQLPDVAHIVVEDLRKGAVTPDLISCLVKKYPDANWWISSKDWTPDWFSKLPASQVRLLFIPQLAANAAIRSDKVKVSAWLTATGEVSYDALEEMDNRAREFPEATIVVLPTQMSAIARCNSKTIDDRQGLLLHENDLTDARQHVSMSSVFFPALIAALFSNAGANTQLLIASDDPQIRLAAPLVCTYIAFEFTKLWMDIEAQRLTSPKIWKPMDKQALDLSKVALFIRTGTVPAFIWNEKKTEWRDSFTLSDNNQLLGIHSGGKPENHAKCDRFEIWRATSELPGYVCCVRAKRKILQQLLEQGKTFKAEPSRQRRSFLIVDSPGSGKSFLVRQYARKTGARLLEFNITQMLSRADLLKCFDTIVTSMAQDRDAAWLVFFDEINAQLDGQQVYASFLTPLEDGYYVREGNKFLIEPCMWIFAGTERPNHQNPCVTQNRSNKAEDFESRLTLPVFDLRVDQNDAKAQTSALIERVYTAVALIKAVFRDVRYITKPVLKAIQLFPTNVTPRDIRRFVKSIEFVQHGTVKSRNLPERWFDMFPDKAHNLERHWNKISKSNEDQELIEIVDF